MSNDEHFMQIALDEANRARGLTSPNPLVGAVIVKDGQILSKGYHHRAGLPHAEVEALAPLGGKAPGATMYVNLEPCSHTGRTPPCSAAVIKAGIKRVVIGVQDPDPRVNGNGIRLLEEAGIEVTTGVLEQASIALNAAFFTAIQKRRPRVSLKVATSLDAQIATHTGDAKWLSGEPARKWAHQMRVEHDAILVGAGTVIADDPSLNVRHVEGRDPLRVVLDSTLRTPLTAKLYTAPLAEGTIVICTRPDQDKHSALLERGVKVFQVAEDESGRPDITEVLSVLKELGYLDIFVEGGGEIHGAFLQKQLVDRLYVVVTPWLIGEDGISAFRFPSPNKLSEAIRLTPIAHTQLGDDLMLTMEPHWEPSS